MFAYARVQQKPGLGVRKSTNEPATYSTVCHCSCHPPQKPPPAVEARLCQGCADERFAAWQDLVEVMMRA